MARKLGNRLGARPLTEEQSKSEFEKKADELQAFQASDAWLGQLKHRHSMVYKGNQGEAADTDVEALGNWQQEVLLDSLTQFSADEVFNVDETGFFWQLVPDKAFKDYFARAARPERKKKERVTVLVECNITGSEKLPLLVIGRSAKPRCSKGKLPVEYKANKKVWTTDWIKAWNPKLKREGRKILFFLDNFLGHSEIFLVQITSKFLPPKTAASS